MDFPVSDLFYWYEGNARGFPWRWTTDPYKVLVTEQLLRQTVAVKVAKVYHQFFAMFPTVSALHRAEKGDIKKVVTPLGLQEQRAGALKAIARAVVQDYGGCVPRGLDRLLRLPHVGLYIANAVRCFSFGEQVPVVDVNVIRVISRYFGVEAGSAGGTREVWDIAGKVLPDGYAREFNYAMLDFGALVCKAVRPLCGECPVCSHCNYILMG